MTWLLRKSHKKRNTEISRKYMNRAANKIIKTFTK